MTDFSVKYKFSFIVIGRNEGWKLSLCFQSIADCVTKNDIKDYEILYVDSQSTDNSTERAKRVPNIKIFGITGLCNAAIARNIGGKEAQGDILFFLDGDMELQADFIPQIFNENGEMVHPFVSGINNHWYYDKDWHLQRKVLSQKIKRNEYQPTTGGFFIITKELWRKEKGMDTRLAANEDLDLGLRLAKKGIPLLRIARVGVIHHTINISESNSLMYQKLMMHRYRVVIARKHLLNKSYLPLLLRMNYSALFLLVSIFITPLYCYSLCFYFAVIMVRSLRHNQASKLKALLFLIIRDFVFVFSLLFFYPNGKKLQYTIIR